MKYNYTEAQAKARSEEIIRDIMKKRPEGNGCTYTTETYWCHDRGYQRKRMVPSKPFFGYDPHELAALKLVGGTGSDRYSVELLIRMYFDKAQTQKINRWHERIADPVWRHIRDVGIPGVYEVRVDGTKAGTVIADNLSFAKRIAEVSFGFLVAGKKDRWGGDQEVTVRYYGQGDVTTLSSNNNEAIQDLKRKIDDMKSEIAKKEQLIAQHEATINAIQITEISQMSSQFE